MRILITTDVVGGVWRYTVTLTRELVDRGHTCAVAVVGDPDDDRLLELPASVHVTSRDLKLEWMQDPWDDLVTGTKWLVDEACRWRPDVVHLNQFAYALGDFPAPTLIVAHSDIRSWFVDVREREAPPEWDRYTELVRSALGAADAVVAPTAYQSGRLAQHYGRTAARVIHNGIRAAPTPADETPTSKRSMILVAGRAWDEAKGIATLDEALDEMGEDAPSVHLVGPLEGPGDESIRVKHLVAHGEVDGSAMHRFYANSRIYVGPSLYEPFGLSPLEAAAQGCALLLSSIGSFRELWHDAARFFEPARPRVLGGRLMDLLETPDTLDELGHKARERARSRYTAQRMTDQYESLYRELIGRNADEQSAELARSSPPETDPQPAETESVHAPGTEPGL